MHRLRGMLRNISKSPNLLLYYRLTTFSAQFGSFAALHQMYLLGPNFGD